LRPDRNAQLDDLAVRAVSLLSASVSAAAGSELPHATQGGEVAQRRVGANDHVTAATPVAAVGPALRHVLLAAEAEGAVAAASGLDVNLRAVVEHTSVAFGDGG